MNEQQPNGDGGDGIWQLRSGLETADSDLPRSFGTDEVNDIRTGEIPEIGATRQPTSENLSALPSTDHAQHPSLVRRTLSHLAESSHQFFTRFISVPTQLHCRVTLLDGQTASFTLKNDALGLDLFHLVISQLDIQEAWYFGLSYFPNDEPSVDGNSDAVSCHASASISLTGDSVQSRTASDFSRQPVRQSRTRRRIFRRSQRHSVHYLNDVPFWLELNRPIADQCGVYIFYFEVRYYVSKPEQSISCSNTRYQYCLQLRQHLITGRLPCSASTHVLLGALIAQMELGDSHPRHSARANSLTSAAASGSRVPSTTDHSVRSQSLSSARTCSLASPEPSDDSDLEVWNQRAPSSAPVNVKYATMDPAAWEAQPSSGLWSRFGIQPDACLNLTHLDVLPHLRYRTRSTDGRASSERSQSHSRAACCCSFGPNWPYPPRSIRNCPLILRRITRLHQRLRGWPRAKAEHVFLANARRLALYGIELHIVKHFTSTLSCKPKSRCSLSRLSRSSWRGNHSQNSTAPCIGRFPHSVPARAHPNADSSELYSLRYNFTLGVRATGLLLLWGQVRLGYFPWDRIRSLSAQRSHCLLVVNNESCLPSQDRLRFTRYNFAFSSARLCARFFRSFVDYHRYFRLGIRTTHPSRDTKVSVHASKSIRLRERNLRSTSSHSVPTRRSLSDRHRPTVSAVWRLCWLPHPDHSAPVSPVPSDRSSLPSSPIASATPVVMPDLEAVPSNSLEDVTSCAVWVRAAESPRRDSIPDPFSPRAVQAQPELRSLPSCSASSIDPASADAIDSIAAHAFHSTSLPATQFQAVERAVTSLEPPTTSVNLAHSLLVDSYSRESSTVLACKDSRPPKRPPPLPPQLTRSFTLAVAPIEVDRSFVGGATFANIPLVRTHACIVDASGRLVRLPSAKPSPDGSTPIYRDSPFRRGLPPPSTIPLVHTRSIRYPSGPIPLNPYMLPGTTPIRLCPGNLVPLVRMNTIYVQYL